MMSENPSKENSKKEDRFYEPRNWDRAMRIEENDSSEVIYCGKCGHIIYNGDKFCTKCGSESKEKKKI